MSRRKGLHARLGLQLVHHQGTYVAKEDAFGLYSWMMAWSRLNELDGFVPADIAERGISGDRRRNLARLRLLASPRVGFLAEAEHERLGPGYVVQKYGEFNETKSEINTRRGLDRERKRDSSMPPPPSLDPLSSDSSPSEGVEPAAIDTESNQRLSGQFRSESVRTPPGFPDSDSDSDSDSGSSMRSEEGSESQAADPPQAPSEPPPPLARRLPDSEPNLHGPLWMATYESAVRASSGDAGWSFDPGDLRTLRRVIEARCTTWGAIPQWLEDHVPAFVAETIGREKYYATWGPRGFERWWNERSARLARASGGPSDAALRDAFCRGVAAGKRAPFAWPGSTSPDCEHLAELRKAIAAFAYNDDETKIADGVVCTWLEDFAHDFAFDVAKQPQDAVRFWSGFAPKGFTRWWNERAKREEARKHG